MTPESPNRRELRRRRRFVARNLRLLSRVVGERPVALPWWKAVRAVARSILPGPDALTLSRRRCIGPAAQIADPELSTLLAPDLIGEFTPDARSIDLLCRRFDAERPTAVLQCGAGASTLAFACLARRRRTAGSPCAVVALEQSAYVRDAVIARLAAAGLAEHAHVVLAPLDADGSHRFDPSEVARHCATPFDWVVVEGPIGPAARRVRSLPGVAPLCADRAAWFLDDAFRDSEIDVLAAWSATPSVEVRGVYPLVGKGLATGRIRRAAK